MIQENYNVTGMCDGYTYIIYNDHIHIRSVEYLSSFDEQLYIGDFEQSKGSDGKGVNGNLWPLDLKISLSTTEALLEARLKEISEFFSRHVSGIVILQMRKNNERFREVLEAEAQIVEQLELDISSESI